jgi:enterochelin esterase-like enzyme
MRVQFVILFAVFVSASTLAQLPVVSSGSIKRLEQFQSKYVDARNVDVWLPDGYRASKKYSVLYMHDGQMLYDSATTWNKTAWDVDDVASQLMQENRIKEIIVVGIWNGDKTRHTDYFPQKPFESLSTEQKDEVYKAMRPTGNSVFNEYKVHSDDYLKFLVLELKPFIDKNLSTYADKNHTFIAGSSMGGLISLYAICEYPTVFGGAACMSTHWPGIFTVENNPIPDAFMLYLKSSLPNPKTHKIYFDYGDQTLDSLYPALQMRADAIMREKGYREKNWTTKYFPGDDHSEKSWRARLDFPLLFLLKSK